MRVKHRLTLSSVLIIVTFFLVGQFVIEAGRAIFFESQRPNPRQMIDGSLFDFVQDQLRSSFLENKGEEINGEAELLDKALTVNREYASQGITLLVYKGDELLTPDTGFAGWEPAVPKLDREREHRLILDNTALYVINLDGYQLRLITDRYSYQGNREREEVFNFYVLACVASVIIAIILINFFLSRFIFRRITSSIDTLSEGVRQIRDGNLEYRIEYRRKDEFSEVCSDFNEMAWRLKDSVDKTQREEQSRKELMAGISHDLRTPLTSIRAYVEGLESGVATSPEKQKRYLDTIKAKTNDLERLIHKLFLFSKLDTGTFPLVLERVNLCGELESMVNSVREEYAAAGLNVEYRPGGEPGCVNADVTQLHNALFNIMENSLKYKDKERGCLVISCEVIKGAMHVSLDDDGPGVPDGDLDKIFDVFYRCDPARRNPGQGSGLGLAITARIMEQLGGSIAAKKSSMGGLSIILSFPTPGDGK